MLLRRWCFLLFVLVMPAVDAMANAPGDAKSNAALIYWRAFATLPRLTDAEQNRLGSDVLTLTLDEQVKKTVEEAGYSLELMRDAAKIPSCDWAIDWQKEGVDVRLPQANGARLLAVFACLRARILIESGRSNESLDDLVATIALGRHVARNSVMITLLSGNAVEHRVMEFIGVYLPKLDAPAINSLKQRFEALHAAGDLGTALEMEEKFALDWFVRKVNEAKTSDALLDLATKISFDEVGGDPRETGRKFIESCGGNAAGIIKFAEQTRKHYQIVATKLKLPIDAFDKEMDQLDKSQADNPITKIVFPAIRQCRHAQARIDIRRALFVTALDIQANGQQALAKHTDPIIGGQFEYSPREGGFELRSKYNSGDNKPVKFVVGPVAK